jgi:RNA polymerase sigma-70 factor (ECF subfamily)
MFVFENYSENNSKKTLCAMPEIDLEFQRIVLGDGMSLRDLTRQQFITEAGLSFESDEELAWRTLQEKEAFGELYRRYRLPVYRYHIARTGNEQDAQDLTSQTFLAALECIASYQFGGCFMSWFFKLAHQILANHFHNWGAKTKPKHLVDIPNYGSYTECGTTSKIEINEIAREIQSLTEDMAEALTLRFFAGLNPSEIGQVMVKSDAAVKMLIYRGLCDLKVQLCSRLEIEND